MALTIQSGARINSLFWIKSLDPQVPEEEASTQKVLADLEPYLKGIEVPFTMMTPKSGAELVQNLAEIEGIAKSRGKPMIHIDTHGNKLPAYISSKLRSLSVRKHIVRFLQTGIRYQRDHRRFRNSFESRDASLPQRADVG